MQDADQPPDDEIQISRPRREDEGLVADYAWADRARTAGEEWVVGAVIPDADGRIFVHRRSPDRQLLPGAWDIPGGHVEPGESMLGALRREIEEETGWQLTRVVADLGRSTWSDAGHRLLEVDYIVAVTGDMARPRLEAGKHDAWAWISEDELDMLRVSRRKGDLLLHGILARAFRWLALQGGSPRAGR